VGEVKERRKKTPAHVFEGVEAKRKRGAVSVGARAAQRPFPVLLATFGYLHSSNQCKHAAPLCTQPAISEEKVL